MKNGFELIDNLIAREVELDKIRCSEFDGRTLQVWLYDDLTWCVELSKDEIAILKSYTRNLRRK